MDPTQNNVFGNQPPMNTGGFGAPMGSGVPMSSGTGDIVLNNGGGKSKKWWIVILLIVLVAAIVGVVVWYFVVRPSNHAVSLEETKDSWKDYYNYLMFGPEGEEKEVTISEWYPARIESNDIEDDSNITIDDYYNELRRKYVKFYGMKKEELSGVDDYNAIVQAFVDYNLIDSIAVDAYEIYESNGKNEAIAYVDKIGASYVNSKDSANSMYSFIRLYLKRLVVLFESGCFNKTTVLIECKMNDLSETDQQREHLLKIAKSNMNHYYNDYFNRVVFFDSVNMNNNVEGVK